MEVGIVGKPNVGKSTFFAAATLAPAEIASYPFTTVEPNRGVAYVRAKCPHVDLGKECNPNNAPCDQGTRLIPVELLDVAGLVPRAHEGRGLGNKFLDDLRQASALVHIVDSSGGTDFEGNLVDIGSHDPMEDVLFLEVEIAHWIKGIIARGWDREARKIELEETPVERALHAKLTGLGLTETQIHLALRDSAVSDRPTMWTDDDLLRLGTALQRRGKPMIIAANKADLAPESNLKSLADAKGYEVMPTSAEYELALRKAAKANLIRYCSGASKFDVPDSKLLSNAQLKALEKIQKYLDRFGSTGVQKCIEEAIYRILDLIVVYPVEDETHWMDKKGRILPDAFLVPRGSTAKDVAFKVHTDLGEHFIRAINGRTKMVLGHDYKVQNGDVIKIVAKA